MPRKFILGCRRHNRKIFVQSSFKMKINFVLLILLLLVQNHPTLPQCGNEVVILYGLHSRDV